MKKPVRIIVFSAVAVLFSALPIVADQSCPVSTSEFDKLIQSNMKNQCLVVAKNCAYETSSVQQRVNELRREIAKGRYVYSADELRNLEKQLNWIETETGNQSI